MAVQQTRIEGADELDRVLAKLPRELGVRVLANGVRAGARVVRDEVRHQAPKREKGGAKRLSKRSGKGRLPGFLRASIGTRTVKDTPFSVTIAVTVGRAFYGMFEEFGTRFQPARPFMRPAFDLSKDLALAKIGASLGRGVERVATRLAGSYAKSGLARKRKRRR